MHYIHVTDKSGINEEQWNGKENPRFTVQEVRYWSMQLNKTM